MLPGRSSSNGSGGRPDGRSKRAAATAPASADSSGGHTEPSGCPTIWPTSCPRYASNVGAAGAAAGAPARYLTDRAIQSRHATVFPWGTFTVNVFGSFIYGVLTASTHRLDPALAAGLGTGFCGALTTYTTFSYETLRLL